MSRTRVPEFGDYDGYEESFADYTFSVAATFRVRCTTAELGRLIWTPRIRRIELVGTTGDRFDDREAIEVWFIGGDPDLIVGSYRARAVATFEAAIPRLSAFPDLTYLALRKDSLVETDRIPDICCKTIVIDCVNWVRTGSPTITPILEFKNRIIKTVTIRDEAADKLTLRFGDNCNPNITVICSSSCSVTIIANRVLRNVKIEPNWDMQLPDSEGGHRFWDRNVDRIPVNILAKTERLSLACVHLVNREVKCSHDMYAEYSAIPECRINVCDAQFFRCDGSVIYKSHIILGDNLQIKAGVLTSQ